MNRFDSVINEKLTELGEGLDSSKIKELLGNLNGVIAQIPDQSQKGDVMRILTNLADRGGKLDYSPIKPVYPQSTGAGSGTAGTGATTDTGTAGATSTAGTAGTAGTSGATGTGGTSSTSSTTSPQQTIAGMLQAAEQGTANKGLRNAQIGGYNKETGYAKG